jgi:hypothetical protein
LKKVENGLKMANNINISECHPAEFDCRVIYKSLLPGFV